MSHSLPHQIDSRLVAPAPFDEAIANIEVQVVNNDLTNHLDLAISSSFGAETAIIPLSDGSELDVKIEIFRAVIKITPIDCSSSKLEVTDPSSFFRYTEEYESKNQRQQAHKKKRQVKSPGI